MAAAQSRPDSDLRSSVAINDARADVRTVASADNFAEHTVAAVAPVAAPREVSSTSEKLSGTSTSAHHRVPMVTDWSTRHVVFAKPRTEAAAARLEHNKRYQMQTYRRFAPASRKLVDAKVDGSDLLDRFRNRVFDPHPRPTKANPLHRDWSVNLNGTGGPTPTVGASQFPAKFNFDINEAITTDNCTTDYVVFNTNTSMLIAFNNLYSGADVGVTPALCGATPSVLWAYDTATTLAADGVTSTSVTLSEDGSTIIFVESSHTNGSVLHILKPHAGDGVAVDGTPAPIAPTIVTTTAGWGACAGCMWNLNFTADPTGTHPTDSNSAPFYDYDTDILYVGDDNGYIHEFINVLNGGATPPTEAGGNWPIFMNASANTPLTGPIFDSASGRIFVADGFGNMDYIETDDGTVTAGPCLGSHTYPCLANGNYNSGTDGIPDPPVVDSSLGTVMVFVGDDQVPGDPLVGHALAAQAPTTGTCVCGTGGNPTGSEFVFADFGPVNTVDGGSGEPIHSGDFDNNYYNSSPGSVAGFMYVCAIAPDGGTGGGNTALRQITFNATTGLITEATATFLPVGRDPYDLCSPVTEVYNPTANGGAGQDLMFFSIQAHSLACNTATPPTFTYALSAPEGGCLMSVDVTSLTALSFPPVFSAEIAEDGGTSGIIVDNVQPEAQASSIYFTPLGDATDAGNCTVPGCAVKVTQSGLQ